MSMLEAEQLSLGYDGPAIVDQLNLVVTAGSMTVLVGPNGCGKSTLLRGLARILKPRSGAVYLDGKIIQKLPTREVALRLGFLPQSPLAPEGMTVRDLIAQGRFPHQRWFQQWTVEDERITTQVLEMTDLTDLAGRQLDTLSGGQRQRAWIAMALAQNTDILLLDEPTTYLDLAHQLEVLQLLQRLNKQEGRTIVMVLHDLNLAARYADTIVALCAGKVVAAGKPWSVMTPEMLRQVFGVEAAIVKDPVNGAPICIPHGLVGAALSQESALEQVVYAGR
ncbi:MAG: iron-enterobactin transporter ATP-binding protein [Herpetosiphonaceae bacterium]|nr:MAG: iron-enterobactin transporter ATP-binding protein [Herpetosiphonaceae bacterium]